MATIESYDLENSKTAISFSHTTDLSDIKLTSYMAYHDNTLYVGLGYFNRSQNGILAAFPLDDNGELQNNGITCGVTPTQTWQTYGQNQGISFYEDKILLSQSYGTNDSKLYVFDNKLSAPRFDLDKGDAIASMTLSPYLEQIDGHNDHVYLLFESASHKYRTNSSIIHMDRVIKINIEDLY